MGKPNFLVFGGSFNPVHQGHIDMAVAAQVFEDFNFDKVIFVPTRESPHKDSKLVSFEHRVMMLKLALYNNPFKLSVCEYDKIYTVDTLLQIYDIYGYNASYNLLLGEDAYLDFMSWVNVDRIIELIDSIIVARRSGASEHNPKHEKLKYTPVSWVGDVNHVSSTSIRKGLDLEQLPEAIRSYILDNGLYRTEES